MIQIAAIGVVFRNFQIVDFLYMPSFEMHSLLALQERDLEYQRAKRSLTSIPAERKLLQDRIKASEEKKEQARMRLREKEVERQRLASETEAAQEKINRLKTQQLSVKKNEEYEALTHEIEALESKIETMEDAELTALEGIDQEKIRLREDEELCAKEVAQCQKEMDKILAEEKEMQAGIDGLLANLNDKRGEVTSELLQMYDQLSKQIKRPPVVVPLVNQVCSGCHLRVSNEVEAKAQKFEAVCCDQCGRMLYVE